MAGMTMGGSTGGGTVAGPEASITSSTCVASRNGLKIAGLLLANTPYMIMSGTNGMDMNGADASAAAGFNTTKPNWHYTGPPLPQAEANQLLTEGNNGPAFIEMARNGCAPRLTVGQDIGAGQYVQATSAAAAPYADPSEAVQAGFVPVSPTSYPVVYYVNPATVASNAAAKRTLDPNHVDGLVYVTTPSGRQVLAGAFYILPSSVHGVPMPYGALVQWHRRTKVCGPSTPAGAGAGAGAASFAITGTPPCPSGSPVQPTPYLSMVWQVPVAGGPLAIQPPDIQILEAAIMQADGQSGQK
jgi:hypothetical protein